MDIKIFDHICGVKYFTDDIHLLLFGLDFRDINGLYIYIFMHDIHAYTFKYTILK